MAHPRATPDFPDTAGLQVILASPRIPVSQGSELHPGQALPSETSRGQSLPLEIALPRMAFGDRLRPCAPDSGPLSQAEDSTPPDQTTVPVMDNTTTAAVIMTATATDIATHTIVRSGTAIRLGTDTLTTRILM